MDAESLREARTRDEDENVETTPPDEEEIRLRGIWIAECYPVSQLDDIIGRLRSIASKKPRPHSYVSGAVTTLEACRRGPYRGGYSGEMIFIPRGSQAFGHADPVELDLPSSVEWAIGWIDAEVATLPVFILQFHIREQAMRGVEQVLRANYTTYAERQGRWTSFYGPVNQKQAAIVAARARTVAGLTQWMADTFPGFFASGGLEGSFPVLEFWTTEAREPFVEPAEMDDRPPTRALFDYMELLRWERPWREWRSKRLPGIVLNEVDHFDRARTRSEDYALELVGRTADLFDGDPLSSSGGRTNEGFMNHLHHHAVDLLSRWSIRCALRGYEIQFAATREQLRTASNRKRRGEIRRADSLAETELRLLQLRADVEPVLGYVRSAAEHARSRKHDPDDFIPNPRFTVDEEIMSWQQDNTETIDWFAERLSRTATELTDVSTAIIGVLTARVNLRLQRHVRVLTLLAAIVAGVALFLQFRS